ncbi:hypothetical protein GGX14DRAFT_601229 [Mycena pura]|uniref:Secreted protein n=1 Tax=Mycena pura TaxID=153505 RepID=A0AAD6US61_9AGAR|nr:hypothetical protein GGX14DRAFT_601229 [Mycena pura]
MFRLTLVFFFLLRSAKRKHAGVSTFNSHRQTGHSWPAGEPFSPSGALRAAAAAGLRRWGCCAAFAFRTLGPRPDRRGAAAIVTARSGMEWGGSGARGACSSAPSTLLGTAQDGACRPGRRTPLMPHKRRCPPDRDDKLRATVTPLAYLISNRLLNTRAPTPQDQRRAFRVLDQPIKRRAACRTMRVQKRFGGSNAGIVARLCTADVANIDVDISIFPACQPRTPPFFAIYDSLVERETGWMLVLHRHVGPTSTMLASLDGAALLPLPARRRRSCSGGRLVRFRQSGTVLKLWIRFLLRSRTLQARRGARRRSASDSAYITSVRTHAAQRNSTARTTPLPRATPRALLFERPRGRGASAKPEARPRRGATGSACSFCSVA